MVCEEHDSQQLPTGDTIVALWFAEDPIGIGNDLFPIIGCNLGQHSPNAVVTTICVQNESATKVWECQDGGSSESFFELLECPLAPSLTPCKWGRLLCEAVEWLCIGRKVWDKTAVITDQPQKLLNCKLVSGYWPIP